MQIKDVSLIRKLIQLVSGPVARYHTPATRLLRRRYYQDYRSVAPWNHKGNFKRAEYEKLRNLTMDRINDRNRVWRYNEFDQMEFMPELASALDIYGDEITACSQLDEILHIECKDPERYELLHALYYDILNVDYNLWGWCRNTCKYGDHFCFMELDAQMGITDVIDMPLREMRRIEGLDERNPNYYKFIWDVTKNEFESIEIIHFRLRGDGKYSPYGGSVLEGARRIFRQLTLLEDAMLSYRISRAPDRRVWEIDTSALNEEDIEPYMEEFVSTMKRGQIADSDTGRVEQRYNPHSVDEDIFLAVGKGNKTKVSTLPGGTYNGGIDDVKYLRDKLFSAIKIPQEYLSRGEGKGSDQTALAQKDIRFSRTIQRIQRDFIHELARIGMIHLYILGFSGSELVDWTLTLNNPSKIAELQHLEHIKQKYVAAAACGGDVKMLADSRWIHKNILGNTPDEVLRINRGIHSDRRFLAKLNALEKGADNSGGASGDMMGAAADQGLADEAMPDMGDEGEDGGGEDMTAQEEEPVLLTAPGRRDTTNYDPHNTIGSKGHAYAFSRTNQSVGNSQLGLGSGPTSRHNNAMAGLPNSRASMSNMKLMETAAVNMANLPQLELNEMATQIDGANLIFITEDALQEGSSYTSTSLTTLPLVFTVKKKFPMTIENLNDFPDFHGYIKEDGSPQYLIKAQIQSRRNLIQRSQPDAT